MSDKPYPDEFTMTIPDDHLTAIGAVVVHWCMLEAVMDMCIGKVAAFNLYDPRGAIVTAHMSWPQKTDVLEACIGALIQDHPHLSGYDKVKPLLKKAQDGRNRIVHGQWGMHEGTVHKLRISARGKLKHSVDAITVPEIVEIGRDIGRAGMALIKVILDK